MLNDAEFLQNKTKYVPDVITILNQLAEQEASVILRRHREIAGASSYTEISDLVSHEINSNYTRFFDFFEDNPSLCLKPDYENAILHSMPRMIRQEKDYRQRIDRLPTKIKHAILSSTLASSMVYTDPS